MTTSEAKLKELEDYLRYHGFSGDIPQNSGHKNWMVIKKLMKGHPFYTFGIKRVEQAIKHHEISAAEIRDYQVAASGITIQRFRRHGPGHFNSRLVAERLLEALVDIQKRAKAGQTIIFATGHPGAMVGLLDELAAWANSLGAKLVRIDRPLTVDGRIKLDMLGRVLVASDGCSAIHTHDAQFMEALLKLQSADFVVADHGFAGAALNRQVPTIGFYDTDDPGLPLAEALGCPVLAVPFNDNNYNTSGAALGRYLIERFTTGATPQPRRSRTRAH